MDQETREAFADLKNHLDRRFDSVEQRLDGVEQRIEDHKNQMLSRFDAVDERLKRVETSVAYLEKQEKGRNRPRDGGGSIPENHKMAAKGHGS